MFSAWDPEDLTETVCQRFLQLLQLRNEKLLQKLSMYVCVSLCIRWMVSQCLCMCICVPLRVSVCMSESVSVHVPMCLSVYVCLLDGQSLPLSVCPCMSVCMCACVSVCVYVCQLEGQSVPLEVHLLKLVAHVDGVVKLLDYFDKPDSFVVVVDRKP